MLSYLFHGMLHWRSLIQGNICLMKTLEEHHLTVSSLLPAYLHILQKFGITNPRLHAPLHAPPHETTTHRKTEQFILSRLLWFCHTLAPSAPKPIRGVGRNLDKYVGYRL